MRYSQQRERRSQVSIVFRPARIHPVFHYAIAVVAAAGAFEIELWLRQSALDRDLFVLSYGAVLISSLVNGERRALARAEEALLTRSNLMAELSHDLKGPLTVIKSTAELL